METINIKTKFITPDKEVINKTINGTYSKENNTLEFYDNDIKTTIYLKNETLIERDNEEYNIKLYFDIKDKTKGIYIFKKLNFEVDLIIETQDLKIEQNKFSLIYEIIEESNSIGTFQYYLEWE